MKQSKTKVMPEKDVMTSANQTPRGYKFAPLVVSQQGRANQHEPACFGLSSHWSFASGSGIPLHAVVQPWLSLQQSISPFCAIPPRPACSRPLVGVDAERSQIVQKIPHTLFFLVPHTAHALHQFSEHHALRQSRTLHARHKSRKQDPPLV